jgi:hypothetical protein
MVLTGVTPDGREWYTLEYGKLNPAERVELKNREAAWKEEAEKLWRLKREERERRERDKEREERERRESEKRESEEIERNILAERRMKMFLNNDGTKQMLPSPSLMRGEVRLGGKKRKTKKKHKKAKKRTLRKNNISKKIKNKKNKKSKKRR